MTKRTGSSYISQLIQKGEELNRELKKIRKLIGSKTIDEKAIFLLFKKLMNNYPANPEVLKCFLVFLQLLNDKDLLKEVSLKDISRLYNKLCAQNKYDIELNMEFFYFLYYVADKEAESLALYGNYKKAVLSSFKEFEKKTS